MKIDIYIARAMRENGVTSLEYGTPTWREYELAWAKQHNRPIMTPAQGYQRVSRALRRLDLFKVTQTIQYDRTNGTAMYMPVFDLADFTGNWSQRRFT